MTTKSRTDFSLVTISDDTFAAMVRVLTDPHCCGLCINKESDTTALAELQQWRDAGVNFIQRPRGDDWIELNSLARAYVIWRQGMRG